VQFRRLTGCLGVHAGIFGPNPIPVNANAELICGCPILIQLFQSLGQFGFANRARDIMADHAPKTVRLDWRQLPQQVLDQGPANRRKSVAIIKAEWSELVVLPAKVESFPQGELLSA